MERYKISIYIDGTAELDKKNLQNSKNDFIFASNTCAAKLRNR